jgi:hypothetical protein
VAELTAQRAAYAKAKSAAQKGAAGRAMRTGPAAAGGGGGGGGVGAAGVAEFARALAPGADGGDLLSGGLLGKGGRVTDEEEEEEDEEEGAAVSRDAWYIAAIDALEAAGRGPEAAEAVKASLLESEQYNRAGAQNATSIARRCGRGASDFAGVRPDSCAFSPLAGRAPCDGRLRCVHRRRCSVAVSFVIAVINRKPTINPQPLHPSTQVLHAGRPEAAVSR